jgi:hypothetical protein
MKQLWLRRPRNGQTNPHFTIVKAGVQSSLDHDKHDAEAYGHLVQNSPQLGASESAHIIGWSGRYLRRPNLTAQCRLPLLSLIQNRSKDTRTDRLVTILVHASVDQMIT